MGQPVTLQINGAVTATPIGVPAGLSLYDSLRLFLQATYSGAKSGRPTISAGTDTPFVIPFEGISRCRILAMRISGQSMVVHITTPNGGARQAIPTSDILVIHAPNGGDEITAIDVTGTGTINYIIAGDQ